MQYDNNTLRNEITLVRLLRRLEKSAATRDDWTPSGGLPKQEVWLRGKKMQQVREALHLHKEGAERFLDCQICTILSEEYRGRRLRCVTVCSQSLPAFHCVHIPCRNTLVDFKTRIDHLESFCKEVDQVRGCTTVDALCKANFRRTVMQTRIT